MKKILSILTLSFVLLLSVVGCASPKGNPATPPSSDINNNEQLSSIPDGSQNAKISREDAKRIALENASVSESDIFDYEAELDYERGILTYDISFETKDFEYEYDINANDGTIIKSEKEPNDIY